MLEFKRKLASVKRIDSIEPILWANRIEKATIDGWHIVVKKDQFKVGDKCIYIEVDSLLPEKPEFEFLRQRKFKVKTIKIRDQISQGIIFSFSDLKSYNLNDDYEVDYDLTDKLGIVHYDQVQDNKNYIFNYSNSDKYCNFRKYILKYVLKLITCLTGPINAMLPWPGYCPRSDEPRIQHVSNKIKKYIGTTCYVSEKLHGASITHYYYKGLTGVCSRNYELVASSFNNIPNWKKQISKKISKLFGIKIGDYSNSHYWIATNEKHILEKLRDYCLIYNCNLAIQSELCGPKISGNMYNFKSYEIFIYNIYDIDKKIYYSLDQMINFCTLTGLTMVPILDKEFCLHDDVDKYIKEASGKSVFNSDIREGVVVRPIVSMFDNSMGRISFKCISEEYLLGDYNAPE